MPELKLENSLVDSRYEVVERLSRGSFAEIFIARDREAGGMEVVIKALNTSLQGTPDADLEHTLIENFQNEAIALDAVRHPHVILRWGHGTAADLRGTPFHYLVLEYMPGGDLLKLCRARPASALSLDEAISYFKQACEGLAYAHGKGIIHRDLKPNNFLLSADQRTLKIADFGVAKITTGEDTEITRVGADIYAPPEHHPTLMGGQGENGAAGADAGTRNRLTASADIYSLAKSFYTVVCGRPPSQFRCDPIMYLPAGSMSASSRRRLLDVLKRATDDDPQARYASVVEFWSDLAQVSSVEEEEIREEVSSDTDEMTMIRPKLNVTPGTLPNGPLRPDFDPALVSAGIQSRFATATLVGKRQAVQSPDANPEAKYNGPPAEEIPVEAGDRHQAAPAPQPKPKSKPGDRSSKFFIELHEPRPAPVIQPQPKGEPLAPQAAGEDSTQPANFKTEIARRARNAADKFTWKARRNIFVGLLIFTFMGAIVSVDRYVRGQDAPFGFGPATEIEITRDGLNVRAGPSRDSQIIGWVARRSRHRVSAQPNPNWLKIQVSQWSQKQLGIETNEGWVNGDLDGKTPAVRVVSRKFWW